MLGTNFGNLIILFFFFFFFLNTEKGPALDIMLQINYSLLLITCKFLLISFRMLTSSAASQSRMEGLICHARMMK